MSTTGKVYVGGIAAILAGAILLEVHIAIVGVTLMILGVMTVIVGPMAVEPSE